MYIYKYFGSVIDLIVFLNEKGVPKNDIVLINTNISNGSAELIYCK